MLTALLGLAGLLIVLAIGSALADEEPAPPAEEALPR